jgi:hypothetical protein
LLRRDDSLFRGLSVHEQKRGCQCDGVHFVHGTSARDGVFVHTASKAYVGPHAQDYGVGYARVARLKDVLNVWSREEAGQVEEAIVHLRTIFRMLGLEIGVEQLRQSRLALDDGRSPKAEPIGPGARIRAPVSRLRFDLPDTRQAGV